MWEKRERYRQRERSERATGNGERDTIIAFERERKKEGDNQKIQRDKSDKVSI